MAKSAASRRRAIRSPSCPHSASPFAHSAACWAAYSSTDTPLRRASSGFTQGRKSSGRRRGKVSSRLPRSPFGSITIAGTPSMAASSSRQRHRPVFPLPVIPTHTAWVTRSRES